ncbi:g1433 [Coccomyxa elongata]
MASKRPPTAFFIFSEEQRESTRAECVAQAEAGAKISVAAVAKAIGEKWHALTDDEKAAYKEKALERAKAQASTAAEEAPEAGQQAEGEDGEQEGEQHLDTQHNANPFGFPLSLIKRIMCLDPEVTRISGDGLKAVAKAAELMVELLGSKAAKEALSHKRKTIKLGDVERAVRTDRRLVEVGLKEVLAEDIFAEAGKKAPLRDAGSRENAGKEDATEGGAVKEAKGTGGRKKAKEDEKARHITDFFSK